MNQTEEKKKTIILIIKSVLIFILFFVGMLLMFSGGVFFSLQERLKGEDIDNAVYKDTENTPVIEQKSIILIGQDGLTMDEVSPVNPVKQNSVISEQLGIGGVTYEDPDGQ